VGFYKKLGFEIFKEKELGERPDGSKIVTYIMVKDLSVDAEGLEPPTSSV
jgi:ribosomal protein S18 acetylase RimI-like enzyme